LPSLGLGPNHPRGLLCREARQTLTVKRSLRQKISK